MTGIGRQPWKLYRGIPDPAMGGPEAQCADRERRQAIAEPYIRRSTITFLTSAPRGGEQKPAIAELYTRRSTIIFLICAIDLAGFRHLGQVLVQFMIV